MTKLNCVKASMVGPQDHKAAPRSLTLLDTRHRTVYSHRDTLAGLASTFWHFINLLRFFANIHKFVLRDMKSTIIESNQNGHRELEKLSRHTEVGPSTIVLLRDLYWSIVLLLLAWLFARLIKPYIVCTVELQVQPSPLIDWCSSRWRLFGNTWDPLKVHILSSPCILYAAGLRCDPSKPNPCLSNFASSLRIVLCSSRYSGVEQFGPLLSAASCHQ